MSVAAAVERAWREGVGPDDAASFAALLAPGGMTPGEPEAPMLRVFGAWQRLLDRAGADVPPIEGPSAAIVVRAAAELARVTLLREPVAIDVAIAELERSLAQLAADDPHGLAARAWADHALADVAIALGDTATALRRAHAIADAETPVALRIHALLRLATLTLHRDDPAPARGFARRALALAEQANRPLHAHRARIAAAMFELLAGDVRGMRRTLGPALAEGDAVARVLAARAESATNAMALLAEGIRVATERGDAFGYMVCILAGARRYAEIGRDADALITITAGIQNLETVAPPLAQALLDERRAWEQGWAPPRYADAERAALASLAKQRG